ncbi:MAG: peptidoglycan-binding protein [Candidatus Pacebacteria bacterium]|nr:peptidoglycan-binding protein [Candidatus Paceibacterota bacterium]
MSKALATKNVAAVLLGLGMILSVFAFATPAKAQSTSDLQAQINALLAQIAALQAPGQQVGGASCATTFTMNLKLGSKGSEVMALQKFLNSIDGTQLATTGAGSPGNETSTFGPATKRAVIKFQEKYAADILTPVGLSKGTGNWFSSTRAKANTLCSTPTTPTTPTTPGTTPGTLAVSAGSQPANSLAPQGSARVPFTNFTLTNTSSAAVTVNGITVTRTGLASDAVFAGVVLLDQNGLQIGTPRTFDTNHMATIGETMTIQPGQSMTFTVAGNMASSLTAYAGQVAALQVTGVQTSSTVSGSLPISGANQTINASLAIGSATVMTSSFDPDSAQTKNIGDTAVKFSGVRITAGSAEDVRLFSVRWRINGSASSADISNVMTVINGTSYPTVVSADGRYYTTTVSGGILMTKGNAVDVYVQGDITGSNSNTRVIEFDIDRQSDIYIVGQTYGYGITPTASETLVTASTGTHGSSFIGSGSVSSQPFFQGSTVTVQGSSVTTIARATEVPSANIAVNVPGQALGGFVADIKGEALTVQTLTLNISGVATTTTNQVTNITLVNDAGVVVAGPVDASGNVVTFNNSITISSGRHVYTIKGTVPAATANGGTFTLNTTPSSWTGITGQTTGNTVTISQGNFTMNTMTVRGATLNITAAAQPAAQTIVAGGSSVVLANIQLDASQSGEDIRMNSLPVNMTNVTGVSSCQLWNGATAVNTGSNTVNPTVGVNVFSFDNSLTIAKGTVVTLVVKCNLSSAATGAYTTGVITSGTQTYAATGVQSGTALTNNSNLTASTSNSGTQTVGSSSVTVTTDPSSPSFAFAAGGTTGVTASALKFRATGEDMTLTELGLTGSAGIASDIVQATIWNGATQVGTVTFTSGSTIATSTLSTPVNLPKDTDVTLTVKINVANVGSSQTGTAGAVVTLNFSGAKATGNNSGNTIYATGSSSVAGVRIEHTYPTLALVSLGSTGVADGKLMRFSMTANAGGTLGVEEFNFTIATSSATATGLSLYAFTDSGFSTPVSSAASGQLNSAAIGGSGSVVVHTNNVTNGILQIPAGQTYYFELRASVAGVVSGSSITTTLLGDTSGTNVGATSTLSTSNLVWTPNSTTTATISDSTNPDWRNGYGVPGLPASGLSQTRNQ